MLTRCFPIIIQYMVRTQRFNHFHTIRHRHANESDSLSHRIMASMFRTHIYYVEKKNWIKIFIRNFSSIDFVSNSIPIIPSYGYDDFNTFSTECTALRCNTYNTNNIAFHTNSAIMISGAIGREKIMFCSF